MCIILLNLQSRAKHKKANRSLNGSGVYLNDRWCSTNSDALSKQFPKDVAFGPAEVAEETQRIHHCREWDRKHGSADLGSDESRQIVSCLRFLSGTHQ